jgi:hypothetical protein
LANVHWEDRKVNEKIIVLENISCDGDKLIGAAMKLWLIPHNLQFCLYVFASVLIMLQFASFATNISCFAKERCILSAAYFG